MADTKKKTGPLSKTERNTLDAYLDFKSDEELAQMIGRNPETIAKYRVKSNRDTGIDKSEAEAIIQELHREYFWAELEEQLTPKELLSFESRWVELNGQFRDIVPTDKMQMIDLCRLHILGNRLLAQEKVAYELMGKVRKELEDQESLPYGHPDRSDDEIHMLRTQLNALMASQGARSKDLKAIQDDKNKLFVQLKSTRDQRIKQHEDAKTTFWDLLRMLQDHETREREGRSMELLRVAKDKITEDFAHYTSFEDNTVDRVLLNSDTVELEEDIPKPEDTNVTEEQQ